MVGRAHLVERVARKLAADGSVSRRELLLGARREKGSAATVDAARAADAGSVPTTPQELAALRAILEAATPEPGELRALVDALAAPGPDGRLSVATQSAIAKVRTRIRRARAQASSVGRRSDLRIRLISYLAESDALLVALAELADGPDAAHVAVLRTRVTSLNTRLKAAEKQILPRLHAVKARRTS